MLRPEQSGRYFADNICKSVFMEIKYISIKI